MNTPTEPVTRETEETARKWLISQYAVGYGSLEQVRSLAALMDSAKRAHMEDARAALVGLRDDYQREAETILREQSASTPATLSAINQELHARAIFAARVVHKCIEAMSAPPSVSHAGEEGWKLVPREPTEEMYDAAALPRGSAKFEWKKLYDAAPSTKPEKPTIEREGK